MGGLVVGDQVEPQFEAPLECTAIVRGTSIDITWAAAANAAGYVIYSTVNDSRQYWRSRVDAPSLAFADTVRLGEIEYFVSAKYGELLTARQPCTPRI